MGLPGGPRRKHPARDGEASPKPPVAVFRLDGHAVAGYVGEPIGTALAAKGVRSFSRSMKFHRPRGLFCGVGKCSSCLMRVNGVPNVPVCVTPLAPGDVVESQNGFPNARLDLFRVNDLVFRHELDHHEHFIRPSFMAPLYHAVMRQFAGFGSIPDHPADPSPAPRREGADLLVVGGGGAGLAAAREAAARGISTLLVEDQPQLGGSLRLLTGRLPGISALGAGTRGFRLAERLVREAQEAGARLMSAASLLGVYEDGTLPVLTANGLTDVSAPSMVAANGHQERTLLCEGNDLPGLMGPRAALSLAVGGVPPGRRAVVVGANWDGLEAARELSDWGVQVVAVVEPDETLPGPRVMTATLLRRGIPVRLGSRVEKVHGFARVRGVTISDGSGRERLDCDLVVVALGRKASPEFFQQAGATLSWTGDGNLVPDAASDGLVLEGRSWPEAEARAASEAPAAGGMDREVGERRGEEGGVPTATKARRPHVWGAGEALGAPSGLASVVSGLVAGRAAASHASGSAEAEELARLIEDAGALAASHAGSGRAPGFVEEELQPPPDEKQLSGSPKAIAECPDRYVCDVCFSNCPKGAIEMANPADPPLVNYDLCDGCGGCAAVCPTQAIHLEGLTRDPSGRCHRTYAFAHDAWWAPRAGSRVEMLDRLGNVVGEGRIRSFEPASGDKAGLVTIASDAADARGWRLARGGGIAEVHG